MTRVRRRERGDSASPAGGEKWRREDRIVELVEGRDGAAASGRAGAASHMGSASLSDRSPPHTGPSPLTPSPPPNPRGLAHTGRTAQRGEAMREDVGREESRWLGGIYRVYRAERAASRLIMKRHT